MVAFLVATAFLEDHEKPRVPSSEPASSSHRFRRGAAFGLAGVVKGLGIGCLKNFGVLDTLKAAVQDKGGADGKEGALGWGGVVESGGSAWYRMLPMKYDVHYQQRS